MYKTNKKKYLLKRTIHKGLFSTIQLAVDIETEKEVIIKEYADEHLFNRVITKKSETERRKIYYSYLQRVKSEKDILTSIKHPNIISLLDRSDTPQSFIVMPNFGITSLKNIIETKGCLNPNKVEYLMQKIYDAIEYLHHLRICHYDVSPSNILLGKGLVFCVTLEMLLTITCL